MIAKALVHLEHGVVQTREGTVGTFELFEETVGDRRVGVEDHFESAGEGALGALWGAIQ